MKNLVILIALALISFSCSEQEPVTPTPDLSIDACECEGGIDDREDPRWPPPTNSKESN